MKIVEVQKYHLPLFIYFLYIYIFFFTISGLPRLVGEAGYGKKAYHYSILVKVPFELRLRGNGNPRNF